MNGSKRGFFLRSSGFTILEMVCVMVLLGFLGLLSTRMFTNLVQGYNIARNSDAAVQKAQNALQRMTIDFTYLNVAQSSGTSNTITYNMNLTGINAVSISQSGNRIVYTYSGTPYTLTDGVANSSLQFTYFNTYSSSAITTLDKNNTALVGISFTMVGDDSSLGLSKTYSTRVKVGKF